MVYNAMKLFMEINPQLFDECSHDYTELQNTAAERQAARRGKWDQLAAQARRQQQQQQSQRPNGGRSMSNANRADEVDPVTHDSQQRLDALKIDEGSSVSTLPSPPAPDDAAAVF